MVAFPGKVMHCQLHLPCCVTFISNNQAHSQAIRVEMYEKYMSERVSEIITFHSFVVKQSECTGNHETFCRNT